MGMSTTIKTRLGDVTIAAIGECNQATDADPIVRAALTVNFLTTPIPMTIAQARGIATIFNTAANQAELALMARAKNRGIA